MDKNEIFQLDGNESHQLDENEIHQLDQNETPTFDKSKIKHLDETKICIKINLINRIKDNFTTIGNEIQQLNGTKTHKLD